MRGAFEQFYRTWCYAGRSVSGADGWKIRAKSAGLPLPEAEGMADLANYWVPTRLSALTPPGTRLALFRPSPTQAVLAHGVLRPGLVGGRDGVSFEHVIARLPPAFSAFEAIRLWHSPAWKRDDGDFSPALRPFIWEDQTCAPEFQARVSPPDAFDPTQTEPSPGWDDVLASRFIDQSPELPWAHALQGCLDLCQHTVEKLFIAGQDDAIARLLYVTFYCLPETFREQLTFSTHENPKGTKGVKIVGVTTFEGEESDLPSYCYEGQYRALNLFTSARSEALELGLFAAAAIDWLRCGQYVYVRQVRAQFQDLDPADHPGLRELDLLSRNQGRGEEELADPEVLLELCDSRAIAHARVARPEELSRLLARASAGEAFETRLARQLGAWLPGHAAASEHFVATLTGVAYGKLTREVSLAAVQEPDRFARMIAPTLRDRFQERLLQVCQAAPWDPPPPLDIRLYLLEGWLASANTAALQPEQAPAHWIEAGPLELPRLLQSGLPFPFKRLALEWCLNAAGTLEARAADALAAAVCTDAGLTRELLFELPRWRQAAGTVAADFPTSVVSKVLQAYNQSLTLAAALRGEDPRILETIELWRTQLPSAVPARLQTILSLVHYLLQPSATASLEGEILSRPFWWAEGGKEEAVNAALDRLLSAAAIEDFEKALEWFGRGAWTLSPPDLISLASHRLAKSDSPAKTADPGLREVIDLLARVLREWDQNRKAPLGLLPARDDKALAPGALSLAALGRIALRYFPGGSLLKSPAGGEILRLLKQENHLLDPAQKDRFQLLCGLLEADGAKEPTPDTLLTLASASLNASLDSELQADAWNLLQKETAKAPKNLRPFLRKFFDSKTEICTQQFLPAFLNYLADREARAKDSSVTDALGQAIADLGNELTAKDPEIWDKMRQFMKKLPPGSRDRFERSLREGDAARAKASKQPLHLVPRLGGPTSLSGTAPPLSAKPPSVFRRRCRTVFLALGSGPALHIYFYALVLATGVLAFRFWRPIVDFFKSVYFPK